jgi:poly(hydroxyalkanoate) granule-associated protein
MAAKKKSAKRTRKGSSDTQTQMLNMMHEVWLAGLGAVSKAQHGAPKLLEELIDQGAHVYAQTSEAAEKALRGALSDAHRNLNARVNRVRGDAADAFENLEEVFRSRVHSALTQLGVPSAGQVESLSKRVDTLNANIEKLARARKAAVRPRAVRRNGSAHSSAH